MAQTIGYKTFGDCSVHGPAIEHVFRTNADDGRTVNVCKLCAQTPRVRPDGAPSFVKNEMTNVRTIKLVNRNGYGAPKNECKSACLTGKRSCDCKCNGRCHGNGVCLGGH
jgi:hypothetical protein